MNSIQLRVFCVMRFNKWEGVSVDSQINQIIPDKDCITHTDYLTAGKTRRLNHQQKMIMTSIKLFVSLLILSSVVTHSLAQENGDEEKQCPAASDVCSCLDQLEQNMKWVEETEGTDSDQVHTDKYCCSCAKTHDCLLTGAESREEGPEKDEIVETARITLSFPFSGGCIRYGYHGSNMSETCEKYFPRQLSRTV